MFFSIGKITPFGRSPIINKISPSTSHQFQCIQTQRVSSIPPNIHSFTVSYLIDTCGFSPQEATSAAKKLTLESRENPDLVINFLKNLGFSKPQILRFTKEFPQCLRCDPFKTLLPKIEFFICRGVSKSDIPKLLCSYPNIMRRSLDRQIIPSFDYFRNLFQSDDEQFIKVLKSCCGILVDVNSRVGPNISVLREAGVPEKNVIKLLQHFPWTFTKSTSRFKVIVKQVQEMGFDSSKYQFIMAVYALSSMSKCTWSKKANLYKKWGWSDDEIIAAFKRYPFCMKGSEDKIDAILEILVNNLGCDSKDISVYPYVLAYSLDERIVPRGAVIQVLLSKGLVKREKLLRVFKLSEEDFLRRFVLCHEQEANGLLDLYHSKLGFVSDKKTG